MLKDKVKFVGYALVIASGYYIYLSISSVGLEQLDPTRFFTPKNISLTSASLVIYVSTLFLGALLWTHFLNQLSGNAITAYEPLIKIYSKSNLGKYLPGNFMHFVSRNVLAKDSRLSHRVIASASLLEVVMVLFSGTLLLALLFYTEVTTLNLSYFETGLVHYIPYYTAALITLGAIITITIKYNIVDYTKLSEIIPKRSALVYALSGYIVTYLLLGLSMLLILSAADNINFTFHNYTNTLFAFTFSWIIGFIIPGAPGGIGIREAALIMLLSQSYSQEAAILASISYRFINILGDVIFYLVTPVALKGQ